MTTDELEALFADLRPRLHRYCARMAGSAIEGEDLVQDTMVKALQAVSSGAAVEAPEAWLFRIAHNTCLDHLRRRSRSRVIPLDDLPDVPALPEPELLSIGFRSFLALPELQRCAVILKDVLGHSVEEVAAIAGCSPAAAKSALQRGRATLRRIADAPEDTRLPLLSPEDRARIEGFVGHFRAGNFDAIRAMLAEDVRLELVNRLRLAGRTRIAPYFTRYAAEPRWRYALGAVEGRPAMLVFDATTDGARPAHFVLVDWQAGRIAAIRDFLFAPYAVEAIDWARLG